MALKTITVSAPRTATKENTAPVALLYNPSTRAGSMTLILNLICHRAPIFEKDGEPSHKASYVTPPGLSHEKTVALKGDCDRVINVIQTLHRQKNQVEASWTEEEINKLLEAFDKLVSKYGLETARNASEYWAPGETPVIRARGANARVPQGMFQAQGSIDLDRLVL